jgi:hypothetical protein
MRRLTSQILFVVLLMVLLFIAAHLRPSMAFAANDSINDLNSDLNSDLNQELNHQTIIAETLDTLAEAVGIGNRSAQLAGPRKIKVAVLDNGFRNFAKARGTTIPESTRLRTGPKVINPATEESHGTKIAEILTNLLDRTGIKYELHLFQSFGISNMSAAVDSVIKEKFDLVLYSQVWEYGGNGDGAGFINRLVNRATASGVTWVNATGNFAKSTYRAPVERTLDDWAYLPGPNGSVQIRCYKNKKNACNLHVALTWNSFPDDPKFGTDRDLDLVLTDDTSKILHVSGKIQKKTIGAEENGVSLYPFEIIEAVVTPGVYYARVKIRSSNFQKFDELKILSSGDFTEMLNRTEGETLLPPADNASVISVGAFDTNKSSYSRSRGRPDLSAPSLIKTADGSTYKGSSNSAAAYAARIAVELSRVKSIDRESMIITLRGGTPRPRQTTRGVLAGGGATRPNEPSAANSGTFLDSTEPGCYVFHALTLTFPHVQKLLRQGGVVVDTVSGPKVFIDENPFTRASRLDLDVELQNADGTAGSILVADANGLFATSVRQRASLAADTVEFVRTPQGARFCRLR